LKVKVTVEYTKKHPIGAGQGLNSEVFLVHDPQFDDDIAVKEIPLSTFLNADYFNESQALYASRHRNIVWVHYGAKTPTHVSIAMPYFAKGSLQKKLELAPLPVCEILEIAQGVLAGVARIHLAGYIHFDLRPPNILFADDDTPLIADFGQARTVLKNGTIVAPRMYVPFFPPEVVVSGVGSVLSDVYQVGLLLYCAANGDRFYRSQVNPDPMALHDEIKKGIFPRRNKFLPHVPRRLRSIIRKALRVNPAERFQSATEMADALAGVRVTQNWQTKYLSVLDLEWEAVRDGQPAIIVRLTKRSGGWDVEVYTRRSGSALRRKDLKLWRSCLPFADADKHLNEVFQSLAS
jgi:eukaryotic-like serine/threonine-protein kinase